jgi:hypothetical protein
VVAELNRLLIALFDVEERYRDVILNLREQQALTDLLDREDPLFACLLSASLRTFAWIEDQRNAVIEAIGEHLPLERELTPANGGGVYQRRDPTGTGFGRGIEGVNAREPAPQNAIAIRESQLTSHR